MPALYDKAGLRFEYPENWLLEGGTEGETTDAGEEETVTLYSPGGAFWTVVRHRGDGDPGRYVEASVQAMREEYGDLDAEPAEETVGGHRLSGYDLNFFCLDLTNTARIRGVRTAGSTLLIFCQADDRELAVVDLVFQAITASLLSHVACSKEARWPAK